MTEFTVEGAGGGAVRVQWREGELTYQMRLAPTTAYREPVRMVSGDVIRRADRPGAATHYLKLAREPELAETVRAIIDRIHAEGRIEAALSAEADRRAELAEGVRREKIDAIREAFKGGPQALYIASRAIADDDLIALGEAIAGRL